MIARESPSRDKLSIRERSASQQYGQPSSVKSSARATRPVGSGNSMIGASEQTRKNNGKNGIIFFMMHYTTKRLCVKKEKVIKYKGSEFIAPFIFIFKVS